MVAGAQTLILWRGIRVIRSCHRHKEFLKLSKYKIQLWILATFGDKLRHAAFVVFFWQNGCTGRNCNQSRVRHHFWAQLIFILPTMTALWPGEQGADGDRDYNEGKRVCVLYLITNMLILLEKVEVAVKWGQSSQLRKDCLRVNTWFEE